MQETSTPGTRSCSAYRKTSTKRSLPGKRPIAIRAGGSAPQQRAVCKHCGPHTPFRIPKDNTPQRGHHGHPKLQFAHPPHVHQFLWMISPQTARRHRCQNRVGRFFIHPVRNNRTTPMLREAIARASGSCTAFSFQRQIETSPPPADIRVPDPRRGSSP